MSKKLLPVAMLLLLAILACSRPGQERIIYVTATFPGGARVLMESPTPNQPSAVPMRPSPDATRPFSAVVSGGRYTVQPGDTLALIADAAGTTVDILMALNALPNPDMLEVGQTLVIPDSSGSTVFGPDFKMLPDSEVIYSPRAADFNTAAYLKIKNGFVRVYSAEVGDDIYMSGVEMITSVAENYSINPRLLLALLEYRGGWLTVPSPEEFAMTYPMGLVNEARTGLYPQLIDAANTLSEGYYSWKYRGLQSVTFADGREVFLHPTLNPGTAAVQYFLSKYSTPEQWQIDVGEQGFFQLYLSMFGDPFVGAIEPLVPPDLISPTLTFPFPAGETWFYTGGPHGGYNTGTAWASIDFAPPAPPDSLIQEQGYCYVSPNWVVAAAPGVVARSGGGFVIIDLDFDGNEHTGWTLVYLHINDDEALVKAGTIVNAGDRLGHPSCEGGFSSATHLHFGRRYNGEWIPIECIVCPPGVAELPMVLSGWTVRGYTGQEYQGYMEDLAGNVRRAEQGRTNPINEVSYSN